jgi:hypothetical protein
MIWGRTVAKSQKRFQRTINKKCAQVPGNGMGEMHVAVKIEVPCEGSAKVIHTYVNPVA